MLELIISGSSEKKTGKMLDRLSLAKETKKRSFYIVPEQITASFERRITAFLGNRAGEYVEITNFSRLPDIVLRRYGNLARNYISDTGKKLIVSRVMAKLLPTLPEIGLLPDDAGVSAFLAESEELRRAGLDSKKLTDLAESGEVGALSEKLSEIAVLISACKKAMSGFDDASDETEKLCLVLEKNDFFAGTDVYIDGFWDFTADEFLLIERIAESADNVFVSAEFDPAREKLFPRGKATVRRLSAMANRRGIPQKRTVILSEGSGEADFLGENILFSDKTFPDEPKKIRIFSAADAYSEAEAVAAKICRLVRCEGAKYGEIAVLSRDGADDRAFSLVFKKHGIPHFSELREKLIFSPVIKTVLFAVKAASVGLDSRETLDYLLSGILSAEPDEILVLSRYVRTWHLASKRLISGAPLEMNPEGYRFFTDASREELALVNKVKEKIFLPIAKLSVWLGAPSVSEKLSAVINFLTATGLEEKTLSEVSLLRSEGLFDEAAREIRLWNSLVSALTEARVVLGDEEVTPEEFVSLLEIAFSGDEAGSVPPMADAVELGKAGFSRTDKAKYVFITNVSLGVFPPEKTRAGLLFVSDRLMLEKAGYPLGEGEDARINEYFIFRCAAKGASERLFISYRGETDSGGGASPIIRRVRTVFPLIKTEKADRMAFPESREAVFEYFCRTKDPVLAEKFLNDGEYREKTVRVLSARSGGGISHRIEKELPFAGRDAHLSFTRIESYRKCPFTYYSKYLARLSEKRTSEPELNFAGSFIHAALEYVLKELAVSGEDITEVSADRLAALNRAACEKTVPEATGGAVSPRMKMLFSKYERNSMKMLESLKKEFSASLFRPVFFEKNIAETGEFTLPLPDGTKLVIGGVIDRVDVWNDGENDWIRVVDYKTGGKDFSLTDVANGINLQMLIYLFALWNGNFEINGKKAKPAPAGIVYSSGNERVATFESPAEDSGERGDFERSGLFVDSGKVLFAQDTTSEGLYLPLKIKGRRSGATTGILVTLEELGRLKKRVEKSLAELVSEMKTGNMDALPLNKSQSTAGKQCEYCQFASLCRNSGTESRFYTEKGESLISPDEDEAGKEGDTLCRN